MKYESLIEDYYGHCFRSRFDANSDEEAIEIVNKDGFNYFANDDCLWRVEGEYVNHSCYDNTQKALFEENYTKIKVK